MTLITRQGKGSKLTIQEMDGNLEYLQSANVPTNITYSELYSKITSGGLLPGSWYRLTDYKSVNFLNGLQTAIDNPTPIDPNFNPREIYEGDTEVLLLQAITESEISPIGYSERFPNDVVQYDPLVTAISMDLYLTNGGDLPNGNTISGFGLQWDGTNVFFEMPQEYPALLGKPFYISFSLNEGDNYFEDYFQSLTTGDITGNYDILTIRVENGGTKIILLDLTEQDFLDYDEDTLYVESNYILATVLGQIKRRQDLEKNIDAPFDFRGRKYRRFECEIFGNITSISHIASGNTATDEVYNISNYSTDSVQGYGAEFRVTVSGGSVTSVQIRRPGRLYVNNETFLIDGTEIGGSTGDDDINITITGVRSNIRYWGIGDVFNGAATTGNYEDYQCFPEDSFNVKFEYGSADISNDNFVVIGNDFNSNTIGSNFYNNTIGNFYNNTIGNNFINNVIGDSFVNNVIGDSFVNNAIDNGFSGNTIGNNFSSNVTGNSFFDNTTGNSFSNNVISGSFFNNRIDNSFYNNTISDNYSFFNNRIDNNFYNNNFYNTVIGGSGFNYNTIGNYFSNNVIGNSFFDNTTGNAFYNNTIGIIFYNNTIGNYFYNNTIADSIFSNTIGSNFFNNTIGSNFFRNAIGDSFVNNTIGSGFVTNTIGNGFNNNTTGISFYNNTIGNEFNSNTIGNDFNSNTIGNDFRFNTISNTFKFNMIKYQVSSTNFSSATHVYGDYNCEIFRRSDNTLQLSYINGSNVIQYVAITA